LQGVLSAAGVFICARLFIRGWVPFLFLVCIAAVAGGAQTADNVSVGAKKTVLILTSERNELPAIAKIESALRDEFANRKETVQFFVEYLDFGRFPRLEYERELGHYFALRYPGATIDAVVPLFEGALEFAIAHRSELFPNAPIVAAAIDEVWLERHPLPAAVAAVPTVYDYRRTVGLMRALNPQLRQIAVVHGVSDYDLRRRDEAQRVLTSLEPAVEHRMLGAIPLAEIEAEVRGLPSSSAVLLLSMVRDAEGKSYVGRDVAARLSAISPVPLFGTFESHLEYGTLGGAITDYTAIGRRTATALNDVLAGNVVSGVLATPPETTSLRVTWRGLQKWNIAESRVPRNARIVGRPPTIWDQYRTLIIAAVVALAIQTVLIIMLVSELNSRRRAEETLRDSESRFHTMADATPVMIWMAGPDKLGTYVNKAWLEFTGRTTAQEAGDGWAQGVHPDDREYCLSTWREAFDARGKCTMEYRLRRRDGEYRWVTADGIPRFTANGKFLGYIGSSIDITERKQSEERLRLAVAALPSAIVMVNRRGTIVLANTSAEKLFGYAPQELNGLAVDELLPEGRRVSHAIHRAEFYAQSRTRFVGTGGDLYAKRKDGSEFIAEIGLNPLAMDDDMLVLTSIIDMTEHNELRRSRQELAHVARIASMGELAGSLAHELNQPLTAILSNAQAAQRYISADALNLADMAELLTDLVSDSNRAAEIIRRMRALVKRSEFEPSRLDAGSVVRDVVALVRSDVVMRGVRLDMHIADDLPQVRGDRIQLQQVVLNLLLNAFDAMKDRPQHERVVRVEATRTDAGDLRIAVCDSGPGIAAGDLERIFTPFFTTKRDGLGLGLSISRSILETHGAQLRVENNADRGVTFYFTLPAH